MKLNLIKRVFPLFSLAVFIYSFFTDFKLILWTAALVLLTIPFFLYGTRKSRVRYWLQGYLNILEKRGLNNQDAINKIREDFCRSKYSDPSVCEYGFDSIEPLVFAIITKEFKFERLLEGGSPENFRIYAEEKAKLVKELEEIKKELNIS